jgi:hypothetical protein
MGRYPPVRLVMPEGINSDETPSATKDNAIKPNKQIDIDTQLPIGISCSERKTKQSIIIHEPSVERSVPGTGRRDSLETQRHLRTQGGSAGIAQEKFLAKKLALMW